MTPGTDMDHGVELNLQAILESPLSRRKAPEGLTAVEIVTRANASRYLASKALRRLHEEEFRVLYEQALALWDKEHGNGS